MSEPEGIITIDDLHLGRPHVIASYLLLGDAPAVVDPGPASTLASLEAGLAAQGLGLEDLRAVVLTHIHLDHAGATGTIVSRNPGVRVYVHERGAPHVVNPERLLDSAGRLYGDMMETLWGTILPVPEAAITTLGGGEALELGGRRLRAYDAPGHARHHLVYLDERSGAAFVGDNCGVRLPGVGFTRPATPPPEIDIEAWLGTLDLIGGLRPSHLLLTHFGAYADAAFHLADYRERLLRWAEQVRAGLEGGAEEAEQIRALEGLAAQETTTLSAAEQAALAQQTGDLALSWRGLARYWRKRQP